MLERFVTHLSSHDRSRERESAKRRALLSVRILAAISLLGLPVGLTPAYSADGVDHSLFGELLRKHVENGLVDYGGFKSEEAKLDRYLEVLEKTNTDSLSRNEQFAFYINAYNAWTIKLILGAYPEVQSIKDLGSFFRSPWGKKIAPIDGDLLTLDNIEHDILRPRFNDPRIHFAVNCASMGCPPLRAEPYRGEVLDRQLTEMTESFINNSGFNRLEENTLYVSKIFKWYGEDFDNGIVPFFLKYARGELRERLVNRAGNIEIEYLDYDWSLNDR